MPPLVDIAYRETRALQLSLAVVLFDAFTGRSELRGEVEVRLAGGEQTPFERPSDATFLFFELAPGAYTVTVRSAGASPFYRSVDLSLNLPMPNPLWPAFPDVTLADPNKMLADPTQTPAYRAQRAAATLWPDVAYPFPAGATLVRGRVMASGSPLADATVTRLGGAEQFMTGSEGELVLFFPRIQGTGETVTLRASHALHPDLDLVIELERGRTVATTFVMAP